MSDTVKPSVQESLTFYSGKLRHVGIYWIFYAMLGCICAAAFLKLPEDEVKDEMVNKTTHLFKKNTSNSLTMYKILLFDVV